MAVSHSLDTLHPRRKPPARELPDQPVPSPTAKSGGVALVPTGLVLRTHYPEGGGPRPENDDEEDPGAANDDEDLEGDSFLHTGVWEAEAALLETRDVPLAAMSQALANGAASRGQLEAFQGEVERVVRQIAGGGCIHLSPTAHRQNAVADYGRLNHVLCPVGLRASRHLFHRYLALQCAAAAPTGSGGGGGLDPQQFPTSTRGQGPEDSDPENGSFCVPPLCRRAPQGGQQCTIT
jgi:hypothetical protein